MGDKVINLKGINYRCDLTNPCNPFDCRWMIFKEELSCCLACWYQHEHHCKRNPANCEAPDNNSHHDRDSRNSLGNIRKNIHLFYFLCIACSLLSFFSVFVNCRLDLLNKSFKISLFSFISLISASLNSWQPILSSSVDRLEEREEPVVNLTSASS